MKQQMREIILVLTALFIPVMMKAQQAYITLKYVDPLKKVFKEAAFFPDQPALADVARGEYASFQFAFRSNTPVQGLQASLRGNTAGSAFITNGWVGYVGYVGVGRPQAEPATDRLISASGLFPDPIIDTMQSELPPGCTQPIWVSVKIPKDIEAGLYHGSLVVTGKAMNKSFSRKVGFTIHVYPVTIDSSSLWVTQWYQASPLTFGMMNNGKEVPLYSPRYWELLAVLAHKMADYGQNVSMISPLQLTQYRLENGKYYFDFSRFDRTVAVLKAAGALKRIEGGHLAARMGGWNSDIGVLVPRITSDTTVFEKRPFTDRQAQDFYEQFIPALVSHVKEKGWISGYMQHIADEPTSSNAETYAQIAAFIKKLAPGVPIMDACHTHKLKMDIWVPQLNFLRDEYRFYRQQQQAGSELWFYTCMWPQGEYANRFIEQPLIKTRLLHWINFRYGITGYLHWGFNQWHHGLRPFEETTDRNSEGGSVLPGGDSYIVYPGYGKLYGSIRLEAMRDGINDYALLQMLDRKYPGRAMEICRETIFDFNKYDLSILAVRDRRKQILETLSK
jgi:hypothetical protein